MKRGNKKKTRARCNSNNASVWHVCLCGRLYVVSKGQAIYKTFTAHTLSGDSRVPSAIFFPACNAIVRKRVTMIEHESSPAHPSAPERIRAHPRTNSSTPKPPVKRLPSVHKVTLFKGAHEKSHCDAFFLGGEVGITHRSGVFVDITCTGLISGRKRHTVSVKRAPSRTDGRVGGLQRHQSNPFNLGGHRP